ncbi:MAG: hypothetical protein KatS3mg011_0073 [Acidimicrobiia bacterium]|nr:MAG: hypothetical protein KatS3mg011_0073 [Acidimicrobiia bacterium]
MVGTLILLLAMAGGTDCPEQPLLAVITSPDTPRVVEYRVVAANPFPWGRSAAVTTRVWGPGVVERWVVSQRRSADDCDQVPAAPAGSYFYRAAGRVGWVSDDPISGVEEVAIQTRFGRPVVHPVGTADLVLAYVRVFPAWWAVGFGVAVGLWVKRRSDR